MLGACLVSWFPTGRLFLAILTFSCTNSAVNGPEYGQNPLHICDYWSQNMTGFVAKEGRVREELRQKIVDKYWEVIELLAAHMLPGNPKDKKIWSHMIRTGPAKSVIPAFEAKLKHEPDDRFEALMAQLDSMEPVELMRTVMSTGLAKLPKKRGGRPARFSLDVRRRAIQDTGHEYARRDRLADAIEVVAARYEMPTEYLRKVWKNRQRLRQRED